MVSAGKGDPVVCGAWEEKIMSHVEDLVPTYEHKIGQTFWQKHNSG